MTRFCCRSINACAQLQRVVGFVALGNSDRAGLAEIAQPRRAVKLNSNWSLAPS